MSNVTDEFMGELGRRGMDPLLRDTTGTIRFDLKSGKQEEHWYATLNKGDVRLEQRDAEADCFVQCDAELFDRIVRGEANAMAAVLRGAFTIGGDLDLLMTFWRLLPGPPNQQGKKTERLTTAGGRS